ncbi:HAD-IA family hydrolase [Billgrantia kenyensis]|uniref:HAD-IA family hydrolase n=1 Tax=Billgrantia kenyensis TaxID=321266 RepID=A0A7V9W3Y3_9GAMM|nr:HAD-IA family hydrolase [Halomonas kenyensis]MBA2780637.1 HAD-IA family hydrolase [Halomonas kenyensis]MCG6663478.1 HAD-IA family hydrolase [Halomonas kenyensis]
MMRPLCLLFDCDGTLVDSEPLLAAEMAASLTRLGLPFQASDYIGEFRGSRFRNIVAVLEGRYGSIDPLHLAEGESEMRSNLNRRLESELGAITGAREALMALIDYPRGVVSNGPVNKIQTSLKAIGFDDFFGEHLYSGYTANCWKPDPRLYLHAATEMGFEPEDCIAIDDALVGVRAALDAGMTVIHLNRFPDAEETPEGAIMISSMFQLPNVVENLAHTRALENRQIAFGS